MNKHFLLYILLILIGTGKISAQLLEQDFSSSTTVANYVSATPNNGQFNSISSTGNSAVSIETTGSNKLRLERLTSGAATYSRTTDFNPEPSAIIYQFDLTVSGNSTSQTTGAVWQVGSGFSTNNSAEAIASVHSRIGLNWTTVDGQFSLRNIGASTSSTTFSGTQTITWVINNSGSTLSYRAPDGTNETLGNDMADVWVGTTRVFNELPATTATQTLVDIKFVLTAGTAIVDIDNILIAEVPAVPVSAAATNVTSTSFTANWLTVTGVTGYRIDVATDAAFTSIVTGYDNLYVAGQSTDMLNITGLVAGTQYYYRVRGAAQYNLGEFASGNSSSQDLTTLTVSQTITTDSIQGAPFCVTAIDDAAVDVDFAYTPGVDFLGAIFSAELSDSSGSFASPVIIGTVASDTTGSQTISANIPAGTISGIGYRIRVVSDNPAVTGTDNGFDFGIYLADVDVTPTASQTIIVNSNGTMLTANEASTPISTEWFVGTTSGGPYPTLVGTGSTYTPNFSSTGVYYVVAISEFDCGIIVSNEVEITVNPAGSAVILVSGTPLIDFTSFTNCPSPSQSFNVSGSSLTDDIILNAPAGFEISTDDIIWLPILTLVESAGTVPPTVIYARYNPSTSGTHTGNITINSTGAAQETVPVTGFTTESVVINKYNVTTDEVELLVIEDNLNLQGMIIKDFSNNMNDDNGGAYEFSNNALWNSIPAGTLIILRNDNSAADTDATDYTLDIGLQNTTYFTSLGGTWDLENTDMVMLKEAGSGSSGVSDNIHILASGSAGSYFTSAHDPKLISTTAASAGSPFVFAINSNSEACDFIGTDAGVGAGLVFGQANNSTNMSFICILRLFPQPTITVTGSTEFCVGDSVILDAGAGYDTYLWSNNETTQTIVVYTSGNFSVTVGDVAGCTAVSTNNINVIVNLLPSVSLGSFSAVCNNDPPFALTGGSPAGGTYSGPGVSAGNFNPSAAGVGSHLITYTFTDANGCTNSDTSSIMVNNCSTVPTIQLQAPYCPYTMTHILDFVYAQEVAGVSNYQYYVEEVGSATPFTATYNRNSGSNILSLMWIKGIQFNTTYAVQVRAFVNGQWGSFGPACNVTTPSTLPTPAINPAFCNITLNNLMDIISIDPVWQAVNYHYEITNVSTSAVMNYHRGSGSNLFSLGWVKGILYDADYSIRVRANINGDWTNFSSPCTISTPGIPATQLENQYCNVILPALNTTISSVLVNHADNYRYTITDSLGFTAVYNRNSGSPLFNLSWIPGIQINTTYYISVQAMQGSLIGPMGTVCAVTAPSMASRFTSFHSTAETMNFSIYPNPNTGDRFTINLENIEDNSLIKVDIYDINGKLVWDKHYTTGSTSITVELGNTLSNGIYTISILNREEIKFSKLIIQK
jgi:hypothetical protein